MLKHHNFFFVFEKGVNITKYRWLVTRACQCYIHLMLKSGSWSTTSQRHLRMKGIGGNDTCEDVCQRNERNDDSSRSNIPSNDVWYYHRLGASWDSVLEVQYTWSAWGTTALARSAAHALRAHARLACTAFSATTVVHDRSLSPPCFFRKGERPPACASERWMQSFY